MNRCSLNLIKFSTTKMPIMDCLPIPKVSRVKQFYFLDTLYVIVILDMGILYTPYLYTSIYPTKTMTPINLFTFSIDSDLFQYAGKIRII